MKKMLLLFFAILILNNCENKIINSPNSPELNVEIRMEVQILDSTYQQYSRPFTQIYFTTYKLQDYRSKIDFQQSDTTSCPNGWGVKLLNFTFKSENEKIILGAACENYNGANYKEIVIDYVEAERRIDSVNHASLVKTFAIYYK